MFSQPKEIHIENYLTKQRSEIISIAQEHKKTSLSDEKIEMEGGSKKYDFKLSKIDPLNKFFTPQKKLQTIFAIIDMQPKFIASRKEIVLNSFEKALNKAMSKGHYILFVNYDPQSKTYVQGKLVDVPFEQRIATEESQVNSALSKIVEAYPYKATIWKCRDSGADKILEHLKSKKIQFSKICVGGVNVCACVSSTVEKLSSKCEGNFLIELNESCCSCDCSSSEGICTRYSINKLEYYKDVVSDKRDSILTSTLEKQNFEKAINILSLYEKNISKYIESKNDDELIEIKRSLLSSLYFLKFINTVSSDPAKEIFDKLNQLLDKIQITFDEQNANRCVIM